MPFMPYLSPSLAKVVTACMAGQGMAWHALISAVIYMSLELHFIQIEIEICSCGRPVDLPIRALCMDGTSSSVDWDPWAWSWMSFRLGWR
jgi:hypothetical protein